MNRRFLCVIAFGLLVFACAPASAQTAKSPLPAPTGYVNDYAKVIDAATEQQLETALTNFDRQQQIQFAIVTVDSTNGQDIFDYSLAVARGWGLGARDAQKPSLLLLVAIKDRKYFTQVSRHLESDLPDGLVGQIQREKLVPAFRAGDYGRGITETIREYISTLGSKRGFSTDSILGASSTPRREVRSNRGANLCGIIVVLVIVIVIISVFMRRGGGPGGGWITWAILGSLLSSGRSSSSGWSSGGFGGFGGGSGGGSSGGGFGGFGGGGDFGGGGSGGSW